MMSVYDYIFKNDFFFFLYTSQNKNMLKSSFFNDNYRRFFFIIIIIVMPCIFALGTINRPRRKRNKNKIITNGTHNEKKKLKK